MRDSRIVAALLHLTPGIEQSALVAYAERFADYSPDQLLGVSASHIALSPEHVTPLVHHISRVRSTSIKLVLN